jgi:hypothetical protein
MDDAFYIDTTVWRFSPSYSHLLQSVTEYILFPYQSLTYLDYCMFAQKSSDTIDMGMLSKSKYHPTCT